MITEKTYSVPFIYHTKSSRNTPIEADVPGSKSITNRPCYVTSPLQKRDGSLNRPASSSTSIQPVHRSAKCCRLYAVPAQLPASARFISRLP